MSRFLYFVRHGHYEPDERQAGGRLTALGRRQARHAARRLAGLPVAAMVTSDLGRATETAAIIAAALPGVRVRQTALLREAMPTAYPGVRVPLATRAEHKERLDAVVERLLRPSRRDRVELVVCHGNLIRSVVCRAIGVRLTAWRELGTFHCGITQIVVKPDGRAVLAAYNDTGHLPHALITVA